MAPPGGRTDTLDMPNLTLAIPTQRAPHAASSSYEQGMAGSPVIHAARRSLQGPRAICNGSQLDPISGRFDVAAAHPCPECAAFICE